LIDVELEENERFSNRRFYTVFISPLPTLMNYGGECNRVVHLFTKGDRSIALTGIEPSLLRGNREGQ